mmetsp:Transcript_21477/g.43569  ORF Transcript_21477/g.43569 Transcript_21477/m.43569 type:complete len:158 (+) Transcript_21477:2-475(+)
MNRPPSHRPQRIVRLPALVQCNHMNRDLHILLIRQSQTPIDRRGSRTQILVRFEPARPALQHVDDGGVRIARVALPAESEIEGQVVRGPQHHFDVGRARGAGRGQCPSAGSSASPVQHGDAAGDGLVALLGKEEVNVGVDPHGSDDEFLSGNDCPPC